MTVRMKRAIWFSLLAAAVTPGVTREAGPPRVESGTIQTRQVSGNLPRAVRSLAASTRGPAWAGYAAPEVAPRAGGGRSMCCFDDFKQYGTSGGRGTCRLEARSGFNIIAGPGVAGWSDAGRPGYFHVLFRIEDGEVVRLRPMSADCSVDVARLDFYWLEGVTAGESLAWLASLVENGPDDALVAIALHDDPEADRLLERYATADYPMRLREQATFWMGNARGRRGCETLSRMLREEGDDRVRGKAIFALTQTGMPEAIETIIRAARGDRSAQVRGEALFWLAQEAGERAASAITEAIENDPETEVKKKAVFALTQLPETEGVPLLIKIAKTHRNPVVRREAIFWLGQAEDPRALEFIEQLLRS